jgi:hypothetical protein
MKPTQKIPEEWSVQADMKIPKISFRFRYSSVPWLLLLLAVLSFGLLIPFLGLYWDDWETTLVLKLYPLSTFMDYFRGNRPLAGWTYFVFGPLLGARPLNWQILSLALRWLTVTAMWWVFNQVWPTRKTVITLSAVLFLVYPLFVQQPIAVSYHQHWTAYLLFFLSLACMILSLRHPRWYWAFTLLGLVCMALHLTVLEYFTGVEFIRPLLLLPLLQTQERPTRADWLNVFKKWLPYLLGLLAFTVIRFLLSSSLEFDPNRPQLVYNLLKAPLATVVHLAEIAFQDIAFVLMSTWNKTTLLDFFDLTQRINLLFWGISALAGALVIGYWLLLKVDDAPAEHKKGWDTLWLTAIAATLLGPLPIWLTNRQVSYPGLYVDRFAMASMFGASLLVVLIMEWLAKDRVKAGIALGVLVMLAVNLHLHTANDFRWSWVEQKRTYWQLYWRAPYIEPQTMLLTDKVLFPYVEPTYAFNLLYNNPSDPAKGAYVFHYVKDDIYPDLSLPDRGIVLDSTHRNFNFHATGDNMLVLLHSDEQTANCLWILDPRDDELPHISPSLREAMPAINLARIEPQPKSADYPAREIFGSEPAHTWCYYYEKAELARQQQDWAGVADLGQQALDKGYTAKNSESRSPFEWMPFIEGFAHQGQWDQAVQLSSSVLPNDPDYAPALCSLWRRINRETPASDGKQSALDQVKPALGCE